MKKLKKMFLILVFLFVISNIKVFAQPLNPSFDDDNFYQCIVDNLNEQRINQIENRDVFTYKVTEEELLKINDLSCISYQIESVKGIEKLENVTYLDFEDNKFKTIDLNNNKKVIYLFVDKGVNVDGYTGNIEQEQDIIVKPKTNSNIVLTLIFILIIYLVISIELFILFSKMNEKRWKALIPVYNLIVLLQITSFPIWNILLLVIPIINIYIYYKIGLKLSEEFNKKKWIAVLFAIVPIIGIIFFFQKNKEVLADSFNNQNIKEMEISNVKIQSQPLGYEQDVNVNNSTITENTQPLNSINENNINQQIVEKNIEQSSESQNINQDIEINPQMELMKNLSKEQQSVNLSQTNEIKQESFEKLKNNNDYRVCPKCNSRLKSDATVCFMCGNKLD